MRKRLGIDSKKSIAEFLNVYKFVLWNVCQPEYSAVCALHTITSRKEYLNAADRFVSGVNRDGIHEQLISNGGRFCSWR
jgi:hypothetical protein